ncbi:hypothetical protein COU61_00465 [Candidatus Pacearchaeota archaeon CG10_big_fil_rev_8_21_14_0_10_35_13]|nr:MAG: hypothetical protein COU61_00465 [Candidatus Pacearchaeota archaeon CG10_big_fil_rev_8_21_14_0_10_35_13]
MVNNSLFRNLTFFLLFLVLALLVFTFADISLVSSQSANVCCERTTNGAWCQNSLPSQCDNSYSQTPSSCESTSFCSLGTCYDSSEGICMDNTPQKACQESGGTWSSGDPEDIPQCQPACCVLGNQAAFTTLTRCKKLSSQYNLVTDFRKNIGSEAECVAVTQSQDKGACVFDSDFTRTCKFTTRSDCTANNASFHKDFLCSSEELATNCGPSTSTTCVVGKEEVYFVDTCGNPANIYDASKVNDKSYWRMIVPKADSCGFNDADGNSNSRTCGSCDYLSGSLCSDYSKASSSVKPTYGNFICQDLDCSNTFNDNDYKHGESWCVNDEQTKSNKAVVDVGTRFYRHLCVAGEEIVEPCADFRQELCVEASIKTSTGTFSQAGCRVNKWQDCILQNDSDDCSDVDVRDCKWINGPVGLSNGGSCVPLVSPGLEFWNDAGNSQEVCAVASTTCVVTYEKDLLSGKKCVDNCECLEPGWLDNRKDICTSLGDCGNKVNIIKVIGGKKGWTYKVD